MDSTRPMRGMQVNPMSGDDKTPIGPNDWRMIYGCLGAIALCAFVVMFCILMAVVSVKVWGQL